MPRPFAALLVLLAFILLSSVPGAGVALAAPGGEVSVVATVHGNRKSRIYHVSRCQHYNCKNCTAVFAGSAEAEAAGYRGCKLCSP